MRKILIRVPARPSVKTTPIKITRIPIKKKKALA
jgi:hypothetical protein